VDAVRFEIVQSAARDVIAFMVKKSLPPPPPQKR
jgi:hypothetical protein